MNLWQHERVAEIIANNLALTKMITPATRELGIGKRDTKMALVLLKTAKGVGLQDSGGNLKRVLGDQQHIYDRYVKVSAYKDKVRAEKVEKEKEAFLNRMRAKKTMF